MTEIPNLVLLGRAASPRPTPAQRDRLLTAEQLAARWQVPKTHVYRLAREGEIPTVRLGRYRRFRLDEIERYERSTGRDARGSVRSIPTQSGARDADTPGLHGHQGVES